MFKQNLISLENNNNNNNTNTDIIIDLQDYMFTSKNMNRFTKHMIQIDIKPKSTIAPKSNNKVVLSKKLYEKKKETIYKPKQKDSLFWCFYILKNGFSKYEMEINNQYFVVEKNEKFKYIEMMRKHKDILKLHKIKPLTEIEDDLANKDNISIKTFFALCIMENINILLVNKRKIYELLCTDVDENHPINIIHKNNNEHSIELDITNELIQKYRDTYYKVNNFDDTLKGIGSYKLDDLIELCKKFDIKLEDNSKKGDKKKLTKKDIYEILVLNY